MKINRQSGFTLVEMAFVLLIMGLIVGSVFAFYSPQLQQKRQQLTIDRENKIARALTDYAQRNGNLPCTGAPDSTTLGDARTDCATNPSSRDGIVPYRLFGLSQDDATDAWGNPFTYAVSFRAQTLETSSTVHQDCRTDTVWISASASLNPNKAYLCCQKIQAAGDQLQVFSDSSLLTLATTVQTPTSTFTGIFDAPSTVGGGTVTGDNLAYFAYVLISHGSNGEGSYVFGQTSRKTFNNAGDAEKVNAGNTGRYVVIPRSLTAGSGYFDDIVLWRTQQGLMTELGNDSCARP